MNELKHGRFYICKRLRLLDYLLSAGFKPIRTVPDPDNWRFKNWIFENSISLEECVNSYFESK